VSNRESVRREDSRAAALLARVVHVGEGHEAGEVAAREAGGGGGARLDDGAELVLVAGEDDVGAGAGEHEDGDHSEGLLAWPASSMKTWA